MGEGPSLQLWGVDDRAEGLYRAALRHPGTPPGELAERLGCPPEAADAAVRSLVAAGLVTVTAAGVEPRPPTEALGRLIEDEERGLAGRQARLTQARTAVSTYAADHLAGQREHWTPVPVDVVSAEHTLAALIDLSRSTTGEVLVVSSLLSARLADDDPVVRAALDLLQTGRPMRALYATSVLDDERALARVRFWATHGERSRLLPSVPHHFVVFGGEAAVMPGRWGEWAHANLLVRTPVLVAAMCQVFELLWDRAVPLPRAGDGSAENERRQVLELLAKGAKDETIARHLGLSLRTVRRRVSDIMVELGASTRFQAGREAARRGYV